MVAGLAEVDVEAAAVALDAAGNDIKRAVLIACGASLAVATTLIEAADGDLRAALARFRAD
jgi:N-acetylmuramic acid 6-phosphate etherase